MRNLWCLEKISILPLVISATGIVPQSLFKNLKILDLDNTLVVEIQKGILLYSCHIVRKFLNIDTEHNTQHSTWKRCKHSGRFSRFGNIIGNFCIKYKTKMLCNYFINILNLND
jgi:hypothetical protein